MRFPVHIQECLLEVSFLLGVGQWKVCPSRDYIAGQTFAIPVKTHKTGEPLNSDMLRAEDGSHPSLSHQFSQLENV